MKRKTLVKVVHGIHVGKIGWATEPNHLGNVMFYPLEGEQPVVICLSKYCVASF